MDIVAIIPARSGSKSLQDKNIALLSGHPLIAYSITAAKCSALIKRVIVSTDSERYASIAVQYGAEVPFLRPAEFSTDNSTDRDFLVHAMSWLEQNKQIRPEYWVHLRPTTPLRDPKIIDNAKKHDIRLALETDLCPEIFADLLYKFPTDVVTVNYDTGNSAALGYCVNYESECYGDRITDIHIKDRKLGGGSVELGRGDVDFDSFFHQSGNCSFGGPMIIQAFRDDEGVEIFEKQYKWLKEKCLSM